MDLRHKSEPPGTVDAVRGDDCRSEDRLQLRERPIQPSRSSFQPVSFPLVPCAYAVETIPPFLPEAIVSIYPTGGCMTRPGRVRNTRPKVSRTRGVITRFSAGASRRMRKFTMENTVEGGTPYGFTLTTRCRRTAPEFAACLVRLKKWCAAQSIGLVIRRALQDRGTEHVHGLGYFKNAGEASALREQWLSITGEDADADARKHSVRFKECTVARDVAGWVAYMCRKGERPVVSGKHWAVWGRNQFSKIPPEVFHFRTRQEVDTFRRGAERLLVPKKAKKIRKHRLPRDSNWRRCAQGAALKRLAEYAGAVAVTQGCTTPDIPGAALPARHFRSNRNLMTAKSCAALASSRSVVRCVATMPSWPKERFR